MTAFDVALTARKNQVVIQMVFPAAVSRALIERGYNRARVEVREDGFLVVPRVGTKADEVAELPEWK